MNRTLPTPNVAGIADAHAPPRRAGWHRAPLRTPLAAALALTMAGCATARARIAIEDVSPSGADIPSGASANFAASGLIAAIDGSGPVGIAGPPTSWSTRDGAEWVEHVAAASVDGRLHVFYRAGGQTWKAVDLSGKTGRRVAVVEPASWQMPDAGELDERLAAPSPNGELQVFTWRSGEDWRAEIPSAAAGRQVAGPVGAWMATAGPAPAEYIAARSAASELLVFRRVAGGSWSVVDVTAITGRHIGAGPAGWFDGSGHSVAVRSPTGDLLLFASADARAWSVQNLSDLARRPGRPVPRIEDRVAAWTDGGRTRLAARSPANEMLVFSHDPVESGWTVTNISEVAGRAAASAPAFWESGSGGARIEHLAAADPGGDLVVFYRGAGPWRAVDVSAITGTPAQLRPTGWVTHGTSPPPENLAAATPGGHLGTFTWRPDRDWRHEDASIAASGRVVYAASQKAGVWRSDDYGRFWRQLSREQPPPGDSLAGTLDVAVILDVAASAADPRIVLAGTGSDHRTVSRAGLYRSADGGATWERKHAFVQNGETLPATQVVFAPDDPDVVFAAGGAGIVGSTDGGITWDTLLTVPPTEQVWHLAVSEADATGRRSLAALGPAALWFAPRVRAAGPPSTFGARWFVDRSNNVFGAGLPATNTGTTQGVGSHVLTFVPGSGARILVASAARQGQSGPIYYPRAPTQNGDTVLLNSTGSLWDVDLSTYDARTGSLQSAWTAVPIPSTYTGAGTSGVAYVYTHGTARDFLVFFANKNTVHVSEGIAAGATAWHRLDGLDASQSPNGNRSLVHADPHDILVSPDFELDLAAADADAPFDQHSSVRECTRGRLWLAHDGGITRSEDCGATWHTAEDGLSTLNFMNVAVSPRRTGDDVIRHSGPYLYGGTTHNEHSFSRDAGATWQRANDGCGDCDAWFADPAQPSNVLRLMPRPSRFDLFVDSLGGPDASRSPTDTIPYPEYVRPFAISFKVLEGYRPIVYTLPGEDNEPGGDYVAIQVEGRTVGGMLTPGDRVLLRARGTFTTDTGAAVWSAESGRAGSTSILPASADVVQASGGHDDTVFYVGDGRRVWRSGRNAAGVIDDWIRVVPNPHPDSALVANDALRFFLNPYDPDEIYIAGSDFVRRSTDGGSTFPVDRGLDDALTAGGSFLRARRTASTGGEANARSPDFFNATLSLLVSTRRATSGESENHADEFILNDMVFDRNSPRRFAAGIAGVFFSADGRSWERLVDARALPGRPRALWYDAVTDPRDPSLYVAYHGRGIVRIHPIR